ncbi:hypothetical protein HELRODRAFT_70378 [Helobdella robusta]|uniref:Protein disulfide-isomerase n=1 Tax=Helobdella robusta TaxID=6412 RepID=T1G058_HELRO|nr:hypothetical protein HELRODRAFT_70378 [Helobdella robusta]ESN91789.1 hypothetical protein HELRODRAFT_70378 [Helobdella robusta]
MILKSLFVAAFFSAYALGDGDVVLLTDSEFKAKLDGYEIALVKFFAPWCGHCKKLAPEFERAATILKRNDPPVILVEVDCTEGGKDSCSKHGVSGYPTLKVFKQGEFAFDYEGPRDADGIVKYMKGKAGPSSKELKSLDDVKKFLDNFDPSVIGFFKSSSSEENVQFQKLASALSDNFRFAHTFDPSVLSHYNYEGKIVMYQPPRLHSKMEPSELVYEVLWISLLLKTGHGMVGHRTTGNVAQFERPLITVYYDVDYVKNPKGTNYWRNRIIKVAKKLSEEGKNVHFAISNADQFNHELTEHGLTYSADKLVVAARNAKDQKFSMTEDFSVDALEKFANDFLEGNLKPYLKSEAVPTSNDGPVKVVVAEEFDKIVNDETKDVLIEFYAPWCGHCKSLAPKYEELAQKLAEEEDIVIAKMDATANDVPAPYDVKGFPTIYFAPKNSKKFPKRYEGGREVDDFIKYLAKESTDPLTKYTRDGKKIKAKKVDL